MILTYIILSLYVCDWARPRPRADTRPGARPGAATAKHRRSRRPLHATAPPAGTETAIVAAQPRPSPVGSHQPSLTMSLTDVIDSLCT